MLIYVYFKNMFSKYLSRFSNNIGIDLGTSNTVICLSDHGIIFNEPTVVAINNKTNKIIAIGEEAMNMIGRTPEHIKIIRPINKGVISDYEITEEFLSILINKANSINKKFLRPQVIIGVPVNVTDVEIKAVEDVAMSAGAGKVFVIEEPALAALGMNLSIDTPKGVMIVDIGGGTTDIVILSLSGIVFRKSIKIAGEKMNKSIETYVRNNYKMIIGEKTTEEIKLSIASALLDEWTEIKSIAAKGRDQESGLPKEILIDENDIKEAINNDLLQIIEAIKEVLENAPTEVIGDILQDGIILTGGGALIKNIDKLFESKLNVKITLSDKPLSDVAFGAISFISKKEKNKEFIVKDIRSTISFN